MKNLINKIASVFKSSPAAVRKPSLCVIDDTGFIRSGIEQDFKSTHEVTCMSFIPDDLSELDPFDVLIVDGEGIGNDKYSHGVDFLKDYIPNHKGKKFVHYTGWCDKNNGEALAALGCPVVSKGSNPAYLIRAVTGVMPNDD